MPCAIDLLPSADSHEVMDQDSPQIHVAQLAGSLVQWVTQFFLFMVSDLKQQSRNQRWRKPQM